MAPEELRASPGRLDAVVAELTGAPRADVQRAILAGGVLVDGSSRPKSFRLLGGERLTVELPGAPTIGPEGPPVPVRYEDADLLVVAKPAGLLTHPTAARPAGTLVNRLLGMEVPLAASGGPLRPGIVHRLDAGTSGLLVVAKTDRAFAALKAMFARHAVERRYLALVRGHPEHDSFTVDAPLGRRAARIEVDRAQGRPAVTAFEVRERVGAGHAARGRTRDRADPSDPCPPGRDRPPDPGRPGLRRSRRCGAGARALAPVPALVADRLRASVLGRARRGGGAVAGGPVGGPRSRPRRPATLTPPGARRTLAAPRITAV